MLSGLLQSIGRALGFRHPGATSAWWPTRRSSAIDYRRSVGTGLHSSVLMSPIRWVQRTFPEAPLQVVTMGADGEEPVDRHPLIELIDRPNEYYSGLDLWQATLYSWITAGNAYWIKVRRESRGEPWYTNVTGEVEQIWYAPHWLIRPEGPADGSVFITHYEYAPTGHTFHVDPANVVHFRNGLDPRNPRVGLSLIESELREIFTDDEAAAMTASLMRNMGIPGILLSPKGEAVATPESADAFKAWFQDATSGDRRGEPLVTPSETTITQFGFDPKALTMGETRDVSEERICAAIGIPAAVVGFGAGLQQTKVGATMRELKALAWEGCILPMQRSFASKLDNSLLPDFDSQHASKFVRFDTSEVEALGESRKETAETFALLYDAGLAKRSECREAMGLDVAPEDDAYKADAAPAPEPSPNPGEPPPPPKSLRLKHSHPSAMEAQVIATAPHRQPTERDYALIRAFERSLAQITPGFAADLVKYFEEMGDALAAAAALILPRKSSESDAQAIFEEFGLTERRRIQTAADAHFLRIASATMRDIEVVTGLAVDLPDEVSTRVLRDGGKRMGLIDLDQSTRDRLFRELAEGRDLGEGRDDLVARIRTFVPAGRWSSVAIRADVIARTESLHAQRVSTMEAYSRMEGVTRAMIFDDRLGYGDEVCSALNGRVVSLSEARELVDNITHPNCTRAMAPVVD